MRKWSALSLLTGICISGLPGSAANAAVVIDEFNAPSLDVMWTMDKDPIDGGSFSTPGGHVRWDGIGNNAYGHIQTTSTYDTNGGLRADAIIRQDHYPVQTWGAGIAIYFDANNYVALKQSAAGGASGWLRHVNVNGNFSQQMGNGISDLRQYWLIGGIELTSTQVKFYGSPITPKQDQFGVTNIDAVMSEIPELAMARPASFAGNAKIIIGKGFELPPGYAGPDFNNSVGSDMTSFMGIDFARINVVPEPVTFGLATIGLLALRHRK